MQIGSCKAIPGGMARGKLIVAKHNNQKLELPILIAQGKREGKTCFISAGIHGDEINAIETINQFINTLNIKKIRGTIIIIPLLNPWGFKARTRYIPFDNQDLNRCFNKKGKSASYEIASTIMQEIISKCDYGIDLHDGNKNILLPHPRIFKGDKSQVLREMSYALGTDIILEREGSPGMMAIEAFHQLKVPVLTVEIGGAYIINDKFIEQGVRGIRNVLIYNDNLQGILDLPLQQFFLQDREGYLSPFAGILHIEVGLGEAVKKDQTIAILHDPLQNKKSVIKAKEYGVVFSIRKDAIVEKNETMLSILHFKVHGRNHQLIPIQAQMLLNKERLSKVITRPTILLDDLFSILGFSYKLVGKTIKTPLRKLEEFLK